MSKAVVVRYMLAWSVAGLVAGLAGTAMADRTSAQREAAEDLEIGDAPDLDEASLEDLVADAQRLLSLRGFDPGPIDGQLGLRTQRAIRVYQDTARNQGTLEALKGPPPGSAEPTVVGIDGAATTLTQ